MKKQNLTEEINRIKEILNFDSPSIIEEQLWKTLIKKVAPNLQRQFFTDLEQNLGKKLTAASESEITAAIRSAEMGAMRKRVAKEIYTAEKQTIDDILKKYDLTNRTQSTAAYTELSANGVHPGLRRDVVALSKAENKTAGSSTAATSSKTANTVTTSVEKSFINIEQHIEKYFPKLFKDQNAYLPLIQPLTAKIEKMESTEIIPFLNDKLSKNEAAIIEMLNNKRFSSFKNVKAKMEMLLSVTKKSREFLARNTYKGDAKTILKRIVKLLIIIEGVDIFFGGYREAAQKKQNLADTVVARFGRRAAMLLNGLVDGLKYINVDFSKGTPSPFIDNTDKQSETQTGYTNNLDGYKQYLEANKIDSTKAVDLGDGRFKQDPTLDDNFIQLFKNGNFE